MIFRYFNHSIGVICASTIVLSFHCELRDDLPHPTEQGSNPTTAPIYITEEANTITYFRSIVAAIGRKVSILTLGPLRFG